MPRPRFSLRSLILLVLLASAGFGLWLRWEPWAIEAVLTGQRGASFSPDGSHVLTYELDKANKRIAPNCWLSDGTHLCRFDWQEYVEDSNLRLAITEQISPAGKWLLQRSRFSSNRILDSTTGKQFKLSLRDDEDWRYFFISPDDRYLLMTLDRRSIVFDTQTSKAAAEFAFSPWRALCSGDSTRLVLVMRHKVVIWNLAAGKIETEWQVLAEPPANIPLDLIFLDDPGKIAISYMSNRTRVFDIRTGRMCCEVPGMLPECNFDPTAVSRAHPIVAFDRKLITLNEEAAIVWNSDDGSQLLKLPDTVRMGGHWAFSRDGKRILTGGSPQDTEAWDVRSGTPCAVEPEDFAAVLIEQFTPDGMRKLVASSDIKIMRLNRPEHWWGIAWLPEFWIATASAMGLIWSLVRDQKYLKSARETVRTAS